MREATMLVAAVAALAAIFYVGVATVGFLAAPSACPGNDCHDAVSTGWFGVVVAFGSAGISAGCFILVRRLDASGAGR